eukprot:gene12245-16417_t
MSYNSSSYEPIFKWKFDISLKEKYSYENRKNDLSEYAGYFGYSSLFKCRYEWSSFEEKTPDKLDFYGGKIQTNVVINKLILPRVVPTSLRASLTQVIDDVMKCDHINLARLFDVEVVQNRETTISIVYEKLGGLFFHEIYNSLNAIEVIKVFITVLELMELIHSVGLVHGSIDVRNIYWLENGKIQLMNLGTQTVNLIIQQEQINDVKNKREKSPYDLPDQNETRIDMWSLAALVLQLFLKIDIFSDLNNSTTRTEKINAKLNDAEFVDNFIHQLPPSQLSIWNEVPDDLKTLVRRLLVPNPPNAYEILFCSETFQLRSMLDSYNYSIEGDRFNYPISSKNDIITPSDPKHGNKNKLPVDFLSSKVEIIKPSFRSSKVGAVDQFDLDFSQTFLERTTYELHSNTADTTLTLIASENFKKAAQQSGYPISVVIPSSNNIKDEFSYKKSSSNSNNANFLSGDQINELKGHDNYVTSVSFNYDGRRIVSGSGDNTIRIWDSSSGDQINELKGHDRSVTSVSFNYDGSRIVSGSHDKTIRIWDSSSGDQINELKGHDRSVTSVSFNYDGSRIVSGSHDKTIRDQINELKGHDNYVTSVSFNYDGSRIVSGSWDSTIRIWDSSSGDQINELKGHDSYVNSVSFNYDGSRIVSGSDDKTIRIWDSSSGDHTIEFVIPPIYFSGSPDFSFHKGGLFLKYDLKDNNTGLDMPQIVWLTTDRSPDDAFSIDDWRVAEEGVDYSISNHGANGYFELKHFSGFLGFWRNLKPLIHPFDLTRYFPDRLRETPHQILLGDRQLNGQRLDGMFDFQASFLNINDNYLRELNNLYQRILPFVTGNNRTYRYDVFIGYRKNSDLHRVKDIYHLLIDRGLDVFFDDVSLLNNELPLVTWDEKIRLGLKNCKIFLSVISEEGLARLRDDNYIPDTDNVLKEMQTALENTREDVVQGKQLNYRRGIIPVVIGNRIPPGPWPHIRMTQGFIYTQPSWPFNLVMPLINRYYIMDRHALVFYDRPGNGQQFIGAINYTDLAMLPLNPTTRTTVLRNNRTTPNSFFYMQIVLEFSSDVTMQQWRASLQRAIIELIV